jgi:hypothetical protein
MLTKTQLEEFYEKGCVALRGAMPRKTALDYAKDVWVRLGYDPDDRSTWAKSRIHMPYLSGKPVGELAPGVLEAMHQLCGGAERIAGTPHWGDGFIVNLGADDHAEHWQPAGPKLPGWHKDGDFFRHFLDSPEQGLLVIVLWSDVVHKGGPTYLANDSIQPIAEFLAARPEGVMPGGFDFAALIQQCSQFEEATGEAGDVFLMHPYQLHASSLNPLRLPRIITNPPLHLNAPMNFNRPDRNYSPIERSVLLGLGVEKLDFAPTKPRERIVPERVKNQQAEIDAQKIRLNASDINSD